MFPVDETTRAGRMLAAGNVSVTFRSAATGQHITIRAKCRKPDENNKWVNCPLAEAKVVFLSVPNAGGGWDDKVGKVTRAKGFVADPNTDRAREFCARQLLAYVQGKDMPNGLEALEESRCGKCWRQLTDPVSIERGIGPECYGAETGSVHEAKEARPSGPSDEDIAKAVQQLQAEFDNPAFQAGLSKVLNEEPF